MKNIVLILMLLVSMACGKENPATAIMGCPVGTYKQTGSSVAYLFKSDGTIGFDTSSLDGCFYAGTFTCDAVAGKLAINLTTPSDPVCGTAQATFAYGISLSVLSLRINGNSTTWYLQ